MEFAKRFYELLRKECEGWGERHRLAERAGLTDSSLNKILRGDTKEPSLASVSAIVDAIGLSAFLDDQPGGCPEVRRDLAKAKQRIKELEETVASLKGQLIGMQKAHDSALEKLAQANKHSSPEKNFMLPELNIGDQDVG